MSVLPRPTSDGSVVHDDHWPLALASGQAGHLIPPVQQAPPRVSRTPAASRKSLRRRHR